MQRQRLRCPGVASHLPSTRPLCACSQAHFSRTALAGDLGVDAKLVVKESSRLLAAAVDVVASSGWLGPALVAMEMSQMVTQGLWDRDSPLLQLPHVTKEVAQRLAKDGVSKQELHRGARRAPCHLNSKARAAG